MKKFLSAILFSTLIFLGFLSSPPHAQAILGDILNSPDMSQEKYVIGNTTQSGILDSINNGYSCALSGCYDSTGQIAKGGIIPVMGQTLTAFYRYPPASSTEYFADVLDNMGLPGAQKALAQGTGYNMLSPFLPIWKAFRNIAYSLYIIIFVVIGIMIMLRTKVNAQTIITIQTALPNLLITLILITFSYAIAGFLLDLMYLLIYLFVYLASANGLLDAGKSINRLMTHNAWTVVFGGRNALVEKAADAISGAFWGVSTGNGDFWSKILSGVTFSLGYLIIACAIAIQMLKLIWTLAKSYIMLIIQTITSPLQILMNAMPGSKAFSGWLKKTASYLAPFPIVALMFIFAAILAGPAQDRWWTFQDGTNATSNPSEQVDGNPFGVNPANGPGNSTISLPPFVGLRDGSNVLLAEDILGIIALCVLLMTPAAAKMAQDALQTKESPYTSEIGAGLGMGWQVGGAPIRMAKQAYSQQHQARLQADMLGKAITRQGGGAQGKSQPPTNQDQPTG